MNDPDAPGALHRLIPPPSPDHVRAVLTDGDDFESGRQMWQEEFAGQRQWKVMLGPPDQAEVANIRVIADRVFVWVREGHPADQDLMDGLNESLRRRFYDEEHARTLGPWFRLGGR